MDIDFKAFFLPFLFAALLPAGLPGWTVGFGAELGKGFGDILEGYEPDDAFGFVGYVLCFAVAGYIIGNRPHNWGLVSVAAVAGALVQAALEAATFLVFGEETLPVAVWSDFGNTLSSSEAVLAKVEQPYRGRHGCHGVLRAEGVK